MSEETVMINDVGFPKSIPIQAVLEFLYALEMSEHRGDMLNGVVEFVKKHLPNLHEDEFDRDLPYYKNLRLILGYEE